MLPSSGPYTIQITGYDPRTKQQELELFLVDKCTSTLTPEPGPFSKNSYSLRLNVVIVSLRLRLIFLLDRT